MSLTLSMDIQFRRWIIISTGAKFGWAKWCGELEKVLA